MKKKRYLALDWLKPKAPISCIFDLFIISDHVIKHSKAISHHWIEITKSLPFVKELCQINPKLKELHLQYHTLSKYQT